VAETRDAAFVGQAFARDRTRTADVEELDATTVREAERHVDRLGGDADAATDATARAYEVRGLGPAGGRNSPSSASPSRARTRVRRGNCR